MAIIKTTKDLRPRDPNDFYPTNTECVVGSINLLLKYKYWWIKQRLERGTAFKDQDEVRVCDPGTGDGVWGREFKRIAPDAVTVPSSNPLIHVTGIDTIDRNPQGIDTFIHGSFLEHTPEKPYQLILGNPPYRYAEKFVRKSVEIVDKENGYILFLLPLSFLESQKRGKGLFQDVAPTDIYVLSRRPSFFPVGHEKYGKTDNTSYALYMWDMWEINQREAPLSDLCRPPHVWWFDYNDYQE